MARGLGLGLTAIAAALGVALLPGGAANAAPTPHYTAGTDTATFAVTGVEDSNCPISTGGDTVFIKPGDKIKFNTTLAGVIVSGLSLGTDKVTGLNISATIDGGRRKFDVNAGQSHLVSGLSAGSHVLRWTASGIGVSSLLGIALPPLNFANATLKSGAKLSWTGHVYVTTSAPQCKISVSTPKTSISVGPVKVGVGQHNVSVPGVTVPTNVPSLGNLNPSTSPTHKSGGTKTTKKPSSSKTSTALQGAGLSVPDMVVPQGAGNSVYGSNGGFQLNALPDTGSGGSGGGLHLDSPGSTSGSAVTDPTLGLDTSGKHKTVDLASQNASPSSQLPVLLAILAVIALAMVAGLYSRIYLLRRKPTA